MFRSPLFLVAFVARCSAVPNTATINLSQEYDVEVVAFILERSAVVGIALDGDRTKRCSNGEAIAAILFPTSVRPQQ